MPSGWVRAQGPPPDSEKCETSLCVVQNPALNPVLRFMSAKANSYPFISILTWSLARLREEGRYQRRKNLIPQLGGIHLSLREQRTTAVTF